MAVIELIRDEDEATLARGVEVLAGVSPDRRILVSDLREYLGAFPHVHLLARIDGEDAGMAEVIVEPYFRATNEAHSMVVVARAHRGRGVGSVLAAELGEWAREQGLSGLRSWIEEGDDASLAWAERRGFREHARELGLELDLTRTEPPPVDPPRGIEIVAWAERPELARGMYDVYVEASPDIPGGEDEELEPFEDWLRHDMQGPSDRPEATFVALADDEVVGYAKFHLNAALPTRAYHDLTGVKRAWRGRGIAAALKRRQIAWAKEHGYERLATSNERRNEPIRRLNLRYGYEPVPGRIFVRGPLP
jgi:GNAT superfamily N-acetyltransferase